MTRLFRWEWKKFWRLKKILAISAACLVLAAVYLYGSYVIIAEDSRVSRKNYESLIEQTTANIATVKSLPGNYDEASQASQKKDIDRMEKEKKLYQEMLDALNSGDWKKRISAQIQEEKSTLEGQRLGNVTGGYTKEEIESKIAFQQYQLDHSIQPLSSEYDINGANLLYLSLRDLFPVAVPLLALLLAAGMLPNEKKNGTLKLLLQQPVRRRKVLAAKFCASLLTSTAIFLAAGAILFLAASCVGGTGAPRFPVPAAQGMGGAFFIGKTTYSTVLHFFLQYLPLFFAAVLFYTAFGLFVSVLSPNGSTAVLVSVFAAVLPQLLNNLKSMPFLQYLPFFMNNGFQTLTGGSGGLPVLAVPGILVCSAALFYGLAVLFFRKKDILC